MRVSGDRVLGREMPCVQIGGCCPCQATTGRRNLPLLTPQGHPLGEAAGTRDAEMPPPSGREREAALDPCFRGDGRRRLLPIGRQR